MIAVGEKIDFEIWKISFHDRNREEMINKNFNEQEF